MARLDTINVRKDSKMYSVVGAKADHSVEVVQNGMVGEVGVIIEDNVYELNPVTATNNGIFIVATPEVDPDESKIAYNTLKGFTLKEGQVVDAIQVKAHDKVAISEDGIEGLTGSAVKGAYVYVVAGKRKLQYKATKPVAGDNALLVGVIEDVVPATQGLFVGLNGQNLAMAYNLVRIRFIA